MSSDTSDSRSRPILSRGEVWDAYVKVRDEAERLRERADAFEALLREMDAKSREQAPAAIPVDVESARGKDDNEDGMICT